MCARLKNGGPHNNRQLLQHIMRFLWWRQLMNVSNVTNKHTRWKENKRKINVNPVQTLLFPSGLNESCLPSTSHSAPRGLQRSVERSQKTQCSRDCTAYGFIMFSFRLLHGNDMFLQFKISSVTHSPLTPEPQLHKQASDYICTLYLLLWHF